MRTKSVLIADDDAMLVRVLTVRCRHLGLEVRKASDAMQALVMIHKDPPDLIIMDVSMPAGDGLSACKMLASDSRLQEIPVIILTGRSDEQIREQVGGMGAHYVLKSPDCWQEIKPLLSRLLNLELESEPTPDPMPAADRGGPARRTPEARSATRLSSSKSAADPASGRPRVLVVDDDPSVTEALRIRLESSNYRVICAHGGAAAYWAAMKQKPNIITLDIGMPELDGADLLKKLKSHPLTRGIPVIVLTGNTDQSTKKELLNLGAAAYLTKPFRSSDLLLEIDNLLAAAGTEAHTDH
ncbi:MAG: response regulator [Planctomycetota bacterium]|nr:response regulator [Planctomycetota bacterium]